MRSREIIKRLRHDGWYLHAQKGSHCQYKHLIKKGKVMVPHPKQNLPLKTVQNILKQAKLDLEVY